jgi:hypothetical protein
MVASLQGREPESRGTPAVGSNVTENTGLCVVVSCETDARQRGRKPLNTEAEDPLLLAAPREDTEEFVHAAMMCCVCRSVNLLQLIVVTSCKSPVNPTINPKPV